MRTYQIKFILIVPSAHRPDSRCPVSATPTHMLRICVNPRHTFFSGRANNACTNLLGFFVRYVRTRGSMKLRGARNYQFLLYSVTHTLATHYFLRLTRARGNEPMHAVRWLASPRQGEKILLNDFWYFSSLKSTIKKSYFMIFSGRRGIKQCEALLGVAETGVAPTPTR